MLNLAYLSDLVRHHLLSYVSGAVVYPCVVGRRSSLLGCSCFLLAVPAFACQGQGMAPFVCLLYAPSVARRVVETRRVAV
jgi:hypothetical protein